MNKVNRPGGTITVDNAEQMQQFGAETARDVTARAPGKAAAVIALRGDLGAGKTTFAQGFLRELGVTQNVISPTFLIMRPYEIAMGGYRRVVHIDCYRLARAEELLALGLRDLLAAPDTILLIEWPEIVADLLPKGATRVSIEHPQAGTTRTVIVS